MKKVFAIMLGVICTVFNLIGAFSIGLEISRRYGLDFKNLSAHSILVAASLTFTLFLALWSFSLPSIIYKFIVKK